MLALSLFLNFILQPDEADELHLISVNEMDILQRHFLFEIHKNIYTVSTNFCPIWEWVKYPIQSMEG